MNSAPKIAVDPAWLVEVDGAPNGEAIYIGVLVPLMGALLERSERLTESQKALALLGLAHLEILNGGVSQLVFNEPASALEVPDALAAFGWPQEAERLARALALFAPPARRGWIARLFGRRRTWEEYAQMGADLSAEAEAELKAIEKPLATFLDSADFFRTLIARIRADEDGFHIAADGAGLRR